MKQVGRATVTPWPGARRVLTFGSRGAGGRAGAQGAGSRARAPGRRREAGGGRGYLSQSLCSMLYTLSSWLRPSKKGMRSSSSVSVMSSNQDCTGTWKTGRGGAAELYRALGVAPNLTGGLLFPMNVFFGEEAGYPAIISILRILFVPCCN